MNNLNRLATNNNWYALHYTNNHPYNNNFEEECSHPLCHREAVTLFDDKYLCDDHYFNWCDKCIDDGIHDGVWMDVDEYEEFVSRNDEPLDRIPYVNTFSGILNNKKINGWRSEQDALPRLFDNTRLFKLNTCVDADGKKQNWSIKLGSPTSILCEHHAKEEEYAARRHIQDVMGKKGQLFNENHLRKIKNKDKKRARVPSLKTLTKNALSTKNMQTSRQYVLAGPETLKKRTGGRKPNKTRKRKKKRKRKTHKNKRHQRKSKKKRKAKK